MRSSPTIQQAPQTSDKRPSFGLLYQLASLLSLARYGGSFHGLHQAHLASLITRNILTPTYFFFIIYVVVAANIDIHKFFPELNVFYFQ
jgi:hypothetical protein